MRGNIASAPIQIEVVEEKTEKDESEESKSGDKEKEDDSQKEMVIDVDEPAKGPQPD